MNTGSFGTGEAREGRRVLVWTLLVTVYILWGSTYLAIRYAVETIPPFIMAAVRFSVSGAVLYLWRRGAGDAPPTLAQWRTAGIIGVLLLVGGNGGVVWAEQRVPSGLTALLVSAVPLWMVILDLVRPGGRWPGFWAAAGILAGFAGIVILAAARGTGAGAQQTDAIGIAVLVAASFLWSAGSVYSKTVEHHPSALLDTGMTMLAGAAGFLVMATVTGEWASLGAKEVSSASLWGLGYLIVFGALVGFAAYTWLIRHAPISLVSTYAYVNPVVAIFLGFFIAHEPVTARIIVAAFIIIGSVVLTTTAQRWR